MYCVLPAALSCNFNFSIFWAILKELFLKATFVNLSFFLFFISFLIVLFKLCILIANLPIDFSNWVIFCFRSLFSFLIFLFALCNLDNAKLCFDVLVSHLWHLLASYSEEHEGRLSYDNARS